MIFANGFDLSKTRAIKKAVKSAWSFPNLKVKNGTLGGDGEGKLCGGETEEVFSQQLARAIFKANGKPCHVLIEAKCLEYVPFNDYHFDEKNPPAAESSESKV